MEKVEAPIPRATSGGNMRRQRSRLQMRAPSSIQVCPAEPTAVAEWRVAIPLLSPLDISTVPRVHRAVGERHGVVTSPPVDSRSDSWPMTWQHPAAPFYNEPMTGNAPGFVLPPHCA
ncbi:uncharacterized protein At4g14450, chloroplastic-like [Typha angustifolia]|uniref:uncharacterized protein At4g14450, chloroplastic-like n=1 Tax=Typha angustifolia TaxID=59011 RepID=UPI003C30312F